MLRERDIKGPTLSKALYIEGHDDKVRGTGLLCGFHKRAFLNAKIILFFVLYVKHCIPRQHRPIIIEDKSPQIGRKTIIKGIFRRIERKG